MRPPSLVSVPVLVLVLVSVLGACGGTAGAPETRTGAGHGTGGGGGTGAGTGTGTGGGGGAETGPVCTALGTGGVRLEEDFVAIDPPIRFARGEVLHASAAAPLDGIAEVLGRCPAARIEVRVSAGTRGDADAALRSAQAKAEAIKSGLTSRGVDAARVVARGVARSGFLEGVAANDAAAIETEVVRVDPVGCAGD